jgi:hypothetical protein
MKTDIHHGNSPLNSGSLWSWHLRLLLAVIWWQIVFVIIACSPSSSDHAYRGISDRHPTGSWHISSDSLVVAFDMETVRPDGRLQDFSPYGHHSILMGTTNVTGLFGDARQFRTPADRIDIPETPAFEIDGPLSIALWFQIDTPDLHQHILAADDKFVVWINQTNRIRFTDTRGNGLETQENIVAGQWYSLAAVFNGTFGTQLSEENIRLYLNGEAAPANLVGQPQDEPPTWKPGQLYPSDAAYIGFESHQGEPTHQELSFEGLIDEVLVFSRALSLKEILTHAGRE